MSSLDLRAANADHPVDCFSVFAAAEPSALLRILEVFSLLGVVPRQCHSTQVDPAPGDHHPQLVVDIQVAGLPAGGAHQVAKRLERVITVTQVLHAQRHSLAA